MTDLAHLLERVGRGRPPRADGAVSLLPGGTAVAAVLGFTAHHVIAANIDPDWLLSRLGDAEMTRPLKPDFLASLGARLHARPRGQDVLLVSTGTAASAESDGAAGLLNPATLDHPRAIRALHYRDDVKMATVPGGLLTVGRGLAGRWEISIEVEPASRGAGIGRTLAEHGRSLLPTDAVLWAQIHPANVASMRAFLAAGYRPVGAEVLFTREVGEPGR